MCFPLILVSLEGCGVKGAFRAFVRAFSVLTNTGGATPNAWGETREVGHLTKRTAVLYNMTRPLPTQSSRALLGFPVGPRDVSLWHSFYTH